MVAIHILEVIVRHLQEQNWYFLGVIKTREVTGPVNRKLVTRPVTIQGSYIPPLLGHTERLCSVLQPKRGTLDGIIIDSRVYIPLTLWVNQLL